MSKEMDLRPLDAEASFDALLGLGYDSIRGVQKNQYAIKFTRLPAVNLSDQQTDLNVLDTVTKRVSTFYLDIWASFGGFYGRGSVDISYLQNSVTENYFTSYQVRDFSHMGDVSISYSAEDDPFAPGTIKHLEDDPADFFNVYGDSFISTVHYGTSLFFDFIQNRSLSNYLQKIDASISGNVGPIAGSISMTNQVSKLSSTNQWAIHSHSIPPITNVDSADELIKNYFSHLDNKSYGMLGFTYTPYADLLGRRPSVRKLIDLNRVQSDLKSLAIAKTGVEVERNTIRIYLDNPDLYVKGISLSDARAAVASAETLIADAEAVATEIMQSPFADSRAMEVGSRLSEFSKNFVHPEFDSFSVPIRIRVFQDGVGWVSGGTSNPSLLPHDAKPAAVERGKGHVHTFSVDLVHPIKGLALEKRLVFSVGSTPWMPAESDTAVNKNCVGFLLRLQGPLSRLFRLHARFESLDGSVNENDDTDDGVEFGYWHGGFHAGMLMTAIRVGIRTRDV